MDAPELFNITTSKDPTEDSSSNESFAFLAPPDEEVVAAATVAASSSCRHRLAAACPSPLSTEQPQQQPSSRMPLSPTTSNAKRPPDSKRAASSSRDSFRPTKRKNLAIEGNIGNAEKTKVLVKRFEFDTHQQMKIGANENARHLAKTFQQQTTAPLQEFFEDPHGIFSDQLKRLPIGEQVSGIYWVKLRRRNDGTIFHKIGYAKPLGERLECYQKKDEGGRGNELLQFKVVLNLDMIDAKADTKLRSPLYGDL